jgi:hypothetical protein
MLPSRNSGSFGNCCLCTGPGVISVYRNLSYVSFIRTLSSSELLTRFADSFYKNITFALTLFWASFYHFYSPVLLLLTASVLLVQRLLGSDRIRRLVNVVLQRHLHHPTPVGHWYLRPIRISPYAGPVSSALSARTAELLLYTAHLLLLGRKCLLPQCRKLSSTRDDDDPHLMAVPGSVLLYLRSVLR